MISQLEDMKRPIVLWPMFSTFLSKMFIQLVKQMLSDNSLAIFKE